MPQLNIHIKDLDKTLGKIANITPSVEKIINNEFAAFILKVVSDAKQLAPVGKQVGGSGLLRNSIQHTSGDLKASANVNVFYAAYVEFGTGVHVFDTFFPFTPDQKEYAKQFFVSGKGFMFPHPYLFPAWVKNVGDLITHLKAQLN